MGTHGMIAETINISGQGNDQISCYLARPSGDGPYPGVVVIHEVFGLTPWVREVTRKIADRGYVAIAPDLHHREGPGDIDDVASVVRAAGGNPDERTIGDVEGSVAYLKSLQICTNKIGVIGYCSGGRQTYLVACKVSGIHAAVDCYGGRVVAEAEDLNERQPVAPIKMTENLNCPLLGLFGAEDTNPSITQVRQMEDELKLYNKTFEIHMYEDAGHGFFADYRPSYNQAAAVDGWEKVFAWFNRYLG